MKQEPVAAVAPEEMLGASDWDDEDLLTVVEASERLVAEIRASRERIRQADDALADDPTVDAAQIEAERARLQELLSAAERIRAAQLNAPG
jgi:hypothetical protein